MKTRDLIFSVILCLFFFLNDTPAQYKILNSVFSNGGSVSGSGANQIISTIGEPIVGTSGNSINQIQSGFRYSEDAITGVERNNRNSIPTEFQLMQNYPNPFNPTTTIIFDLPKQSHVILKIYNILGQEVKTLVNETKNPGSYHLNFNATELASGVYIYRIRAGEFTSTKKMMLIK
jgi:hypothetical protein